MHQSLPVCRSECTHLSEVGPRAVPTDFFGLVSVRSPNSGKGPRVRGLPLSDAQIIFQIESAGLGNHAFNRIERGEVG
jgi:hypothetical protein